MSIKTREVSEDILTNYILPLLDNSKPLSVRLPKALVLPSMIRSLLIRSPLSPDLIEKIKLDVEYYRKLGYDITSFRGQEISDVLKWYDENSSKREDENTTSWIRRVAIVSAIIVTDVLIQRRPREIVFSESLMK